MNGIMSSTTSTRYRMGQYDTFRDLDKVKYLRRKLLSDKLESQITFFKSLEKPELNQAISKRLLDFHCLNPKDVILNILEKQLTNLNR